MKTLTVKQTSEILGQPEQLIRVGLQRGILPFGHAIKMEKQFSYIIYKKKLEDYIGEVKLDEI